MKLFVLTVLFLMIFVATMAGQLDLFEILILSFLYLLIVSLEYGTPGNHA